MYLLASSTASSLMSQTSVFQVNGGVMESTVNPSFSPVRLNVGPLCPAEPPPGWMSHVAPIPGSAVQPQ